MHSPPIVNSFALSSVGFAHHLVAEDDGHLFVLAASRNRFDTGLFGSVCVEPVDVALEFAHEEEQAHDHQRPGEEHQPKKDAVGHTPKCRRR